MKAVATPSLLINPPPRSHIALFYDNRENLYRTVADYINTRLYKGQFCVYATVNYRDEHHIEKFSSLITDFEENVEVGNLLVVDLASYYISAMIGDMKPFEEAKKLFEEKGRQRADKHVRFVGDGTGLLFKNRHFDECAMVEQWWNNGGTMVEQWWQDKPFEGSYVCPFSRMLLENFPHDLHAKRAVMATHDIIINISSMPLREESERHNLELTQKETTETDIVRGVESEWIQ